MAKIKLDPRVVEVATDFVTGVLEGAKQAALDEVEHHVRKGFELANEIISGARSLKRNRTIRVEVKHR